MPEKAYFGDSVYGQLNNWGQLRLTTENGLPTDPSNEIFLDPEVLAVLIRYVEQYGAIPKRGGCQKSGAKPVANPKGRHPRESDPALNS